MSAEPDVEKDEGDSEDESQATSMRDQLSKEVAFWSKVRRRQADEAVIPPAQPSVPRRAPAPAAKSKNPPPSQPSASQQSKPFSMSYDGMTQAQYVKYLRDRNST
jgi:hypothetical protein